jgi:hypothetical protein
MWSHLLGDIFRKWGLLDEKCSFPFHVLANFLYAVPSRRATTLCVVTDVDVIQLTTLAEVQVGYMLSYKQSSYKNNV